ncbi:hypothetical protein SAY86_030423 [Trapa natans]|uniref:BHLH domain-containing protein n=1 Tax=Trapa natans TaxID=22666 RepID=A0AAN7MG17_TRANT|nr:hypothetical protein SAY86_030423 [Trapa natans]
MAGSGHEGIADELFDQIMASPLGGYAGSTDYGGGGGGDPGDIGHMHMVLQSGSSGGGSGERGGGGMGMLPLGLNLEQSIGGLLAAQGDGGGSVRRFTDRLASNHHSLPSNSFVNMGGELMHSMTGLFPAYGQPQPQLQPLRPQTPVPPIHQPFQSQQAGGSISAAPIPPAVRQRVRARRGQATDPHSIAERLRRERIAERMKELQELVPSCNKMDRAAMLDEIVDYVKFLKLQVKVLSVSRMGGPGAVAKLIADVPLSSVEGESMEGLNNAQPAWDKWSTDGIEQRVAKLMEEDVGAAMQFLQSKALCIMPISLASAVFSMNQPDSQLLLEPESMAPT